MADTTNKDLKALLETTEGANERNAKRQETLLEAVKLGNKIEDLNSRGEGKRAEQLQVAMNSVLETLKTSNNGKALENRLSEIVNLSDQANNILDANKNVIEGDETVNRLSQLSESIKGQTDVITTQTKNDTESKKSLNKLLMTTEAGDPFIQQLKQDFEDSQANLQAAIESGNQQDIDLALAQVKATQDTIQTEEDKREAMAKQEEANSLLANMADGIENFGGKAAKTAGFLAGIAGLATLFFSPETFAKIVQKAIEVVKNIVSVVDDFINGDFESAGETIKENFGTFAAILGAGIIMVLPKLLRAFRFLQTAFTTFRVFMASEFVANMMANLRSMMSSVGGAFMKVFRGLTTIFQTFRLFMMGTFIPSMIAGFSAMIAGMTPVLLAMAPILLPILAIAALFGGIYLGLNALKEAMGFTSIFDVIMLGVAHLQDAFGHVVNAIGSIVNFIFGIVEGIASFIGFDVELPKVPKMSTDNAEKKKAELDLKAEQERIKKAEEERKQAELNAQGPGTEMMDLSAENALANLTPQTDQKIITQQNINQSSSESTRVTVLSSRDTIAQQMARSYAR
tara:strand:- start:765 stop:2477 length:1713 start_codon:yes stop_codon:yes gene_type:complete